VKSPVPRRHLGTEILFPGLLLLGLLFSLVHWFWQELWPGWQEVPPDFSTPTVVVGTEVYPGRALLRSGEPLLDLALIRERLYPHVHWDPQLQTAVITTGDQVVKLRTGSLTAWVNEQPLKLPFPAELRAGRVYLPLPPLASLLGVRYQVVPSTRRVLVDPVGSAQLPLTVSREQTVLRTLPSLRGAVVARLTRGDRLWATQEERGWFLARSSLGVVGYVHESAVVVGSPVVVTAPEPVAPPVARTWFPPGTRVVLVWEHVQRSTPAPADLDPLPGVNVVSPTWFHLGDAQGNLTNHADLRYVQWAHEQGYQVWALFSNRFSPELTHAFLSSLAARTRAIKQLLALSALYDLDGINLDFENVYLQDRELLVQFVRELVPLAHEQGLVVSVDVTVKSNSPNWSLVYDRAQLAAAADYVILMAYDEHGYAGSPVGPVASLPWVEQGILGLLAEVPRHKLILGIPFYTRIWQEERQPDGSVKVSSRAVGMAAAEEFVAAKGLEVQWDPTAGQYVARGTEGNVTYTIWLEDEQALRARVNLVSKYGLAGIAAWRRGFETPSTWQLIQRELHRRP